MNRKEYEEALKLRQEKHLRNVRGYGDDDKWQPCMHDNCSTCHGTMIRLDGSQCVHMISCPCPSCAPYSLAVERDESDKRSVAIPEPDYNPPSRSHYECGPASTSNCGPMNQVR